MCEGVCNKCREKLQWRFKYNKYKPLKTPSSCRDCNNKSIHKAYRALCDTCATKRKVCSSCSKDIVAANIEYIAHHKVVEEEGTGSNSVSTTPKMSVSVTTPDDYVVSIMGNAGASASTSSATVHFEGVPMEEGEDESENENENSSKKFKKEHEVLDMREMKEEIDNNKIENNEKGVEKVEKEEEKSSNLAAQWDERKFNTIANLKYSKDRVVGSTEDGSGGASTVFSFTK